MYKARIKKEGDIVIDVGNMYNQCKQEAVQGEARVGWG